MSDVVNNFNFEFLSNFDDLDDLSLSQAVDKYELAEISSGEFDDIDFGLRVSVILGKTFLTFRHLPGPTVVLSFLTAVLPLICIELHVIRFYHVCF